jgi:hypothetical protein
VIQVSQPESLFEEMRGVISAKKQFQTFYEKESKMSFKTRNDLVMFGIAAFLLTICVNSWAQTTPGVVIDYYYAGYDKYIASPSIAVLPNGDFIASHDAYGPGHTALRTYLFRSQDGGLTWQALSADLSGQYESTLFVHNGDLYLIGGFNNGAGSEYVTVRRSTDGGETWTTPIDDTTGLISEPAYYNGAPVPVLVHNGRIWRAIEKTDPNLPSGYNFRELVVSAPVGSDLLQASSWTISNNLLSETYLPGTVWFEGNVAADPNGNVVILPRLGGYTDKSAIIRVSSNGTTITFDPNDVIDFPGGATKFTIRYDSVSGRYWSLANKQSNPSAYRNRLILTSSSDLKNWVEEAVILEHPNSVSVAFQYVDWQIHGSDIVAVSRTAYAGADSAHDANYFTFHRIHNFRSMTTTRLIAADDSWLDQHPNWAGDTKGIPHPEWGWTAAELHVGTLDPNGYAMAYESQVLIKWDLSTITSTDVVTDVVLELVANDSPDGPIEVYGVAQGSWEEDNVTWNNWDAMAKTLTYLGSLTLSSTGNPVNYSDPNMTAWVQKWVNGQQANNGILLKWAGPIGTGDSFSSHEDIYDPNIYFGPKLSVSHIPQGVAATVQGNVAASGYTGNKENIAVLVEFRQGGIPVRTERKFLDTSGNFSIPLVEKGTYDLAVKSYAHLQEVLTRNVNADPYSLGTITLQGGDLNGDGLINSLDLDILADNWLATGDI